MAQWIEHWVGIHTAARDLDAGPEPGSKWEGCVRKDIQCLEYILVQGQENATS